MWVKSGRSGKRMVDQAGGPIVSVSRGVKPDIPGLHLGCPPWAQGARRTALFGPRWRGKASVTMIWGGIARLGRSIAWPDRGAADGFRPRWQFEALFVNFKRRAPIRDLVCPSLRSRPRLADGRSGTAHAQGKLDARYNITLAGIPVGRGTWVIDIAEDHFTASASGQTAGLMRVLASGHGQSVARGSIVGGQIAAVDLYVQHPHRQEIRRSPHDDQRRRRCGISPPNRHGRPPTGCR